MNHTPVCRRLMGILTHWWPWLFILCALVSLMGCSGVPPKVASVCPIMPQYSMDQRKAVVAELDVAGSYGLEMPETQKFIGDYWTLRKEVRDCYEITGTKYK